MAHSRSIPELLTKLFRDITDLFRKEGELIRSELNDKITQLQIGVGKIAAGAITILVALIVLADALVIAVAEIIGSVPASENNTGWAALIVGGVFAAIGAFLVRSGTTDLKVENITPDRTALQLRRDAEMAKEQMR
ncbi:phage holin family protein [Acuticoccus sp. M5D2P5]|uniref:phage holin family protein n=1 Tax=Acuticoccus kalidii TaxID=2910977 RepID=UPI001F209700|nr:phage holin family protein [Acuticoccus kalidii]MCF3933121.1 phage holin family protein [Acuticoccus kalidii]